jgi:hypothetical protein
MLYTQKYYLQKNTSALNQVTTRVGIFVGLDFTTNLTLEMNSNKYLSTIPSFSFSSNFTKVLIDYSNSKNNTDITLLNGLFFGLTAGATFTISSAQYSIDGVGSEANLGGTYEFESFIGNVIVATPIALNSANTRLLKYEADYFVNPPQFGLSLSPEGRTPEYVITNSVITDKNVSFIKFGIYPGDKIKISGTELNNGIFTIKGLTTNKDKSEYLTVEEGLTQESAFGDRVSIELLQERKGADFAVVAATGPVDLGACGVYVNGSKVACYENQTQVQCSIRASMLDGTSSWFLNSTCDRVPTTITTTTTRFVPASSNTNPLASLSGLGYFGSGNSVNL